VGINAGFLMVPLTRWPSTVPAVYWPRTTSAGFKGCMALNTLTFSLRIASASNDTGGSIAVMATT
jgi:hypothetical protein